MTSCECGWPLREEAMSRYVCDNPNHSAEARCGMADDIRMCGNSCVACDAPCQMKQAFEKWKVGRAFDGVYPAMVVTWQAAWRAATGAENEACAQTCTAEMPESSELWQEFMHTDMSAEELCSRAIRARLAQMESQPCPKKQHHCLKFTQEKP